MLRVTGVSSICVIESSLCEGLPQTVFSLALLSLYITFTFAIYIEHRTHFSFPITPRSGSFSRLQPQGSITAVLVRRQISLR